MTELNRAGVDESLGHIDTTQGEFRDQIDVVSDELRQLAGNADVPDEALNAPYVLYVNGYTGSDTFVGGDYHDQGADPIETRISLQRLECGYTPARPFRTINRAALEAAIITSHEDFATDAERGRALVSIQVSPGEYTVLNGVGSADTDANFPARADNFEPTDAELTAFNDETTGGVILPRGTSLVSLDLRKTVLRPAAVPAVANEQADYSNRRSIFKVTGTGYYYGFTFKDQAGSTASHHLLSCFEFTPEAQLNALYSKIRKSFGFMDISDANAVAQEKEYQIVGEQPVNAVPAVDTVGSASPYIYNISNRSVLGLCGIFANGANSDGFRSMVVAQYTGVSLQTDFNCWQIYNQGTSTWATAGSQQNVINAEPDDTRMDPARRSFHIRAVNDAVIQEVSVFAIGQGIHHWVESGGELTVTNSNSNWGGCAALAEGFHDTAAPGDTPFTPISVRRALSPFEKTQNVEKIFLGTIAAGVANNAVNIDIEDGLQESSAFPGQPAVLADRGYSLKNPDRIWVENPQGDDYSAVLAATPWQAADPDRIVVTAAFETPGGDDPGDGNSLPDLAGRRIYVRRLIDTRTVEERTYSLKVSGNADRRLPIRDYVLRDAADTYATTRLSSVSRSTIDRTGADLTADVVLRNANHVAGDLTHSATTYYHKGDPITRDNKHLVAVRDNYGAFDADDWSEEFVHMREAFAPEGVVQNSQPIIIFDGDTQNAEPATNCGFAIGTAIVEAQYESGTDYKGMQYYLTTAGDATSLVPTTAAQRDIALAGAANIEFRRPSNIRLFGHAYEWAGFGNYSKALPQYQGDLAPTNKFTYYFTNEEGGKVYASGFNEEGYAVTPQGLQDIETGEVRSVVDIGSPDVAIPEPPTTATTGAQGLVSLESGASIPDLTAAQIADLNTEINGSPAAITRPWLDSYLTNEEFVNVIDANFMLWVGNNGRAGKLNANEMTDQMAANNTAAKGADTNFFTDLNQAVIWLSRRLVRASNTVTIWVEDGDHTVATPVVFSHPNGDRIRLRGESAGNKTFNPNAFRPQDNGDAVPEAAATRIADMLANAASPVRMTTGNFNGTLLRVLGNIQLIRDITFIGNTARDWGNGVWITGAGNLDIRNIAVCRFGAQLGTQAGGFNLRFDNCTFDDVEDIYLYDNYCDSAPAYPGQAVRSSTQAALICNNTTGDFEGIYIRGIGNIGIRVSNSNVRFRSGAVIGNDDAGNNGRSQGQVSMYGLVAMNSNVVMGYNSSPYMFVNSTYTQASGGNETNCGIYLVGTSFGLHNHLYFHARSTDAAVTKQVRIDCLSTRMTAQSTIYRVLNGLNLHYNEGDGADQFVSADCANLIRVGLNANNAQGTIDASGDATDVVKPAGSCSEFSMVLDADGSFLVNEEGEDGLFGVF